MRTAWLLRLYPPTWRERYGGEFAALLDDCQLSPLYLLDIVRGALDAHLHCESLTGRILLMTNRLRRAEIAIFCAWIAFVVAGMGFQKLTEYDDFMDAARRYPLIGISYDAVVVGAVIALLAVLAGGVPLALVTLRQAAAERRGNILLLFTVPPLALAMIAAYLAIAFRIPDCATSAAQRPTTIDKFIVFGLAAVLALGAALSAWAVSTAISRGEAGERWYRFARIPAFITTLAMVVMCAAVIVWGLALRAYVPQLFNGNDGIAATSTALSWLAHVVVMTVAAAVAVVAVYRGMPPRSAQSAASVMPA